ncbi:hypothetical protein GALL_555020 [mine drainage metagenome]|uniref:Uncharacterized protein n=1 Tax=mine drainage metagenome TaxID=410659 RepID=A0A1J5PCL1_9ZZZZ
MAFVVPRTGTDRIVAAGTVIDAPGLGAISAPLPFAASNHGETPMSAPRARIRPRTSATWSLPNPASPCRTVTRTTVGLDSTRPTGSGTARTDCVTSIDSIRRAGRLPATTVTALLNGGPAAPVTVSRYVHTCSVW